MWRGQLLHFSKDLLHRSMLFALLLQASSGIAPDGQYAVCAPGRCYVEQ